MTKAQRLALMKKHWGKHTPDEIAEMLGVTLRTIWRYKAELGLPGFKQPGAEEFVDEFKTKRQLTAERRKTKELAKTLAYKEEELEAAQVLKEHRGIFEVAHGPCSSETRAVAIAVLSDFHIEEVVVPEVVNNLNEFNQEVCEQRIGRLFRHMVKLVTLNQQHAHIHTLVMFLLGDLISSNIHLELLETARCRPIDAAIEVMEYLAGGIEYILDNTDVKLIVPCKVGNHGRITKKVHVSTEAGNSLEWFIYNALAARFKGNDRVEFIIERSMESYIDVWPNFRIRYMHGHSIRGGNGIGGVAVPILRTIFKMDHAIHANLTVMGHFHQYLNLGKAIINGSLIGWAPFASYIHAKFELPRQAFCLVDESVGVTIACPIILSEDR